VEQAATVTTGACQTTIEPILARGELHQSVKSLLLGSN